jgi:hypothetical protein
MNRDDRERFADLFDRLVYRHADEPDDDAQSALRVLSHAFLNYIDSTDDTGNSVVGALPWMAALHRWSRRDWDAERVAGYLLDSPAVEMLGEKTLAARLQVDAESSLPRAPRAASQQGAFDDAVAELAEMEAGLRDMDALDADARIEQLVSDSYLAASAAELCGRDPETPLARALERDSDGLIEASRPWDARFDHADALWVLRGLECEDEPHPMSGPGFEFSKRSLGFERGLASNLVDLGLAPAVRAALMFGRGHRGGARRLSDLLRRSETFRNDAALEALADALASSRGVFIDYMRGLVPLSALDGWVDYLRDGCVELAESRDITLREATGYAHYAMHLVNMCDLCAEGPEACSEATRDALRSVEDELKEFALAGTRGARTGSGESLTSFEAARWRSRGAASEFAARLARLRGAWRRGLEPGPVGSPPTLDADVTAHSLALIDSQIDDADAVHGLNEALRNARLRGFDCSERLSPEHLLGCLTLALGQARDLAAVDITGEFVLDFEHVARWIREGRTDQNLDVLREFLNTKRAEGALQMTEPTLLTFGVVGRVSDDRDQSMPVVEFEFVANRQMEAILELLGSTDEDDSLNETLRARLRELIADAAEDREAGCEVEPEPTEDELVGTVIPGSQAVM